MDVDEIKRYCKAWLSKIEHINYLSRTPSSKASFLMQK